MTTFWSRQLHDQAFCIRSDSDDRPLQVFFGGIFHEFIDVFRSDDDSHTFLRFGNSQFRYRPAFVFLRDFVEVDVQAVCQFADSDGDTAGTEVVAAFDEYRDFTSRPMLVNDFLSVPSIVQAERIFTVDKRGLLKFLGPSPRMK